MTRKARSGKYLKYKDVVLEELFGSLPMKSVMEFIAEKKLPQNTNSNHTMREKYVISQIPKSSYFDIINTLKEENLIRVENALIVRAPGYTDSDALWLTSKGMELCIRIFILQYY